LTASVLASLRKIVAERARNRCEYCLLQQALSLHMHEPDHIVPVQHGGHTEKENLALSCMRCNRFKGPNIGSFDPENGKLVPFFNPLRQKWSDHFSVENAQIIPLTAEARVTVKILRFNDEERVTEREGMIEAGLF
jgi:hypothetical protein